MNRIDQRLEQIMDWSGESLPRFFVLLLIALTAFYLVAAAILLTAAVLIATVSAIAQGVN